MKNFLILIIYYFTITNMVKSYSLGRQTPINLDTWNTNISPEILNELKDFQHLIPTTTIDEIVAKHLLIDGNFRKALKYLRSQEFKQLQRQVENLPEVVNILEFLHLTNGNATTRHMGATTATADIITTDAIRTSYENDNNDAMTTNTDPNVRTVNSMENIEETLNNRSKKVHKRPHTSVQFNSVDAEITSSFNLKQTLVHIVLLKDSMVTTSSYDVAGNHDHHFNSHQQNSHRYRPHISNNYHHHEHYQSLGTFTNFVEEVLQHLPHEEYKNMIKEKCQKNQKFAEFYQALRSQEFKPLVEQAMQTSSIQKVINTLNSHDVDISALKPIAFQVISWGPNV